MTFRRALAVVAVLAGGLAACGDDEPVAGGATTVPPTADPSAADEADEPDDVTDGETTDDGTAPAASPTVPGSTAPTTAPTTDAAPPTTDAPDTADEPAPTIAEPAAPGMITIDSVDELSADCRSGIAAGLTAMAPVVGATDWSQATVGDLYDVLERIDGAIESADAPGADDACPELGVDDDIYLLPVMQTVAVADGIDVVGFLDVARAGIEASLAVTDCESALDTARALTDEDAESAMDLPAVAAWSAGAAWGLLRYECDDDLGAGAFVARPGVQEFFAVFD